MVDTGSERARRRRGAALEEAILDATWEELASHGYESLTLEAVARRAGTSRPVLSRRWDSLSKLASAAIARYAIQNPIDVPDLGSLREELLMLLRQVARRSSPKLVRLIYEMRKDLEDAFSSFADIRSQVGRAGYPTQQILDRAIARGEVAPERITPRLLRLPVDLARHEMMITFQPLSEPDIYEIVDDIVLPLWTARV
ncbi:TetR/AcrR family transcriptional regulator [Xinfangfangia sp. D13-10-4-6]|uniref:TetR/AcrR family transcriptional regulator n=1 Tax=Pseudogemmobacter hezensis TaxID=2737662 RepID=UPI001555661F|nr:TetR/AcrR family transcriptional regulator [Pseudogemmobacter hezensis]NPD14967.1 TetR/AcrR family transcriptional regulator [Pseudogemmobacter hezensis]